MMRIKQPIMQDGKGKYTKLKVLMRIMVIWRRRQDFQITHWALEDITVGIIFTLIYLVIQIRGRKIYRMKKRIKRHMNFHRNRGIWKERYGKQREICQDLKPVLNIVRMKGLNLTYSQNITKRQQCFKGRIKDIMNSAKRMN